MKYLLAIIVAISFVFSPAQSFDMELIWEAHGERDSMLFGASVSGLGDINNDGYDDIIIGAYTWYITPPKAYIYYGGNPMDTIPDIILNGSEDRLDFFGVSVYGNFDINNDFRKDFIIAGGIQTERANAYLYLNTPILDTIPDFIFESFYWDYLKWSDLTSVISGYDINGDSVDDLLLRASLGSGIENLVYLYFGGLEFDTIPDLIFNCRGTRWFGGTIDISGDFNGDGYKDYCILLGSWPSVSIAIFLFREDGIFDSPDFVSYPIYYDDYGPSFAPAGDVNGDGYGDVIVGNSAWGTNQGQVLIFAGDSFNVGIPEIGTKTPDKLSISCYPNPYNSSTSISFSLNMSSTVQAYIYNILGESVCELVNDKLPAGTHTLQWNAEGFPSGIYFCKVNDGKQATVKKLLLMK